MLIVVCEAFEDGERLFLREVPGVVSSSMSNFRITSPQEGAEVIVFAVPRPQGTFEEGAPAYAYTATPNPHVSVEVNLTFTIGFGDWPVGMKVLKRIGVEVMAIANRFEAEVPEFRVEAHASPPKG